ncbi:MAG: biotin/lipoyl-containing protein [Anaerolineae bacterium]
MQGSGPESVDSGPLSLEGVGWPVLHAGQALWQGRISARRSQVFASHLHQRLPCGARTVYNGSTQGAAVVMPVRGHQTHKGSRRMSREVRLPKLGAGMDEGVIVAWLKREGDRVMEGESLLQVETDKAVAEVESPVGGLLVRIVQPQGSRVEVNTVIAHIDP